jgi:hypothetical protein
LRISHLIIGVGITDAIFTAEFAEPRTIVVVELIHK